WFSLKGPATSAWTAATQKRTRQYSTGLSGCAIRGPRPRRKAPEAGSTHLLLLEQFDHILCQRLTGDRHLSGLAGGEVFLALLDPLADLLARNEVLHGDSVVGQLIGSDNDGNGDSPLVRQRKLLVDLRFAAAKKDLCGDA